ncbi:hypothetical protein Lepto7376_0426 [[Leptolyngbya] sp. PCC 7376]|uniref:hypothetical protein n=1 Tax=[Leptolyngbya] sp. PCC 7376 TaxID=111781 RepID=UPI00029F1E11|nr:hypothetical protein [[Leptolyngbya] sp. PCC 7376]AFY36861.1 hypothetical protein Lepto7376_0426 [[Leptolyngbya] sp. PCC 7376]
MATSKQNLSDLLRQEVKQDTTEKGKEAAAAKPKAAAKKVELPTQPSATALSRMTKAQLLKHIEWLQSQPSEVKAAPIPDAEAEKAAAEAKKVAAKNAALAKQVKALEGEIATQNKAIATAEKTIKTLKTDSAEKTKLKKELTKQQGLVEKLYAQVQVLEAEVNKPEPEPKPEPKERTVDEDRALVLARISSYQANLQFPTQPASSIPEEDIGWFD